MQVQDVMSHPAITVLPSTSTRAAAALLLRCQVTAMPVVDPEGAVIGIVSESDVLSGLAALLDTPGQPTAVGEPESSPEVADVMSTSAICVSRWAKASDAANEMLTADVRSLPVVDGSHVVGIVSRSDLLRAALSVAVIPEQPTEWTDQHAGHDSGE